MNPQAPPSGFGLAGMRERVESLGGTLEFARRGVRGMTLCVELPLTEMEHA
jgi:signal transduction histidine kinase